MDALDQPHHDGSPLYVDSETPPLGSTVAVRVRTYSGRTPDAVWLRTTQDAEPTFHECAVIRRDENAVWWEGALPVANPMAHYRFMLVRGGGYEWLTGAGVFDHDVPDAFDFKLSIHPPSPDWARDGVVYQIFPDRFARSASAASHPTPDWATPAEWDDEVIFEGSDPRTPLQFFGGDLDGIAERLDHIAAVGADIVYTTPVFPGESNHRYNASSFDSVDPLLGGDAAYARLAEAVHARGWRILGDLTTNHTGDTHEWFASALDGGPERDWYFFRPDGSYETWMGHATLPKLDHSSATLREAMTNGDKSVVARWLRPPYNLDGWRIDVANMSGRLGAVDVNHEVARAVRRTATAERPDALVIGEHNHDASDDLPGDGWHGTMNYSGFSWPVWEWLRTPGSPARAFGVPVPVPPRTGQQVVASIRMWHGRFGFRNVSCSWNILGSHDSARIRTLVGSGERHRVAAGLQFTLPGVPMVFAGDEIGLEGVNGEDGRRPMPWDKPDSWDQQTLGAYGELAVLRRDQIALRRGGLRWAHVSDDAIVFVREHSAGSVLVAARRTAGPEIRLPAGALGATDIDTLFCSEPDADCTARVAGDTVVLPAPAGPLFTVHVLR